MHYLWFDDETSGTEEQHNLLTVYFCIMNEDSEFVDDLELFLKPENLSDLVLDPVAMEITGIDIEKHLKDPRTVTYAEGEKLLEKFLTKHKIKGKRKHYRPCGHNVEFDIRFLQKDLLTKGFWGKMVDYKTLDTLRILTFLQDCGILPPDLGKLGTLVDYFGLRMGNAHDAKEDIKMTIAVYCKLKELVTNMKLGGGIPDSLLDVIER